MTDDIALILAKLDELTGEVRALRERIDDAPQPAETDTYLTVAEAAVYCKVSPAALYRLKHLQCRRGRSVRFKRSDLDRHLRPRRWQRKSS
jgi:excisionase family DNA binding protein